MNKTGFSRVRLIAIVLFGAVFPSIVMYSAFSDISKLTSLIDYDGDLKNVVTVYDSIADEQLKETNEYILFSLLITENANQNAMVNKQVMKAAVMQIGFAVISIGMLFIVLGFNEGGIDGAGSFGDFSFDLKTGSSGLAAFMIGAVMATMGGVLKNEYKTVPVPDFVFKSKHAPLSVKDFNGLSEACKKRLPNNVDQCIVNGLNARNKDK